MDDAEILIQGAFSEINEICDELDAQDEMISNVQSKVIINKDLININNQKIQKLKISLAIKKFIYLLISIFLIFFFIFLCLENRKNTKDPLFGFKRKLW